MGRNLIKDWEEHGYTEEQWNTLNRHQRYKIRHREAVRDSTRRYAARNKRMMSDRQRKYQLRDKYGITEADYEEMLLLQEGRCAICKTDTPTGKWKRFAVDHCHHTGVVRGLLCNECNRGMGLLRDNPTLLREAANYLENYKENKKNVSKE